MKDHLMALVLFSFSKKWQLKWVIDLQVRIKLKKLSLKGVSLLQGVMYVLHNILASVCLTQSITENIFLPFGYMKM